MFNFEVSELTLADRISGFLTVPRGISQSKKSESESSSSFCVEQFGAWGLSSKEPKGVQSTGGRPGELGPGLDSMPPIDRRIRSSRPDIINGQ